MNICKNAHFRQIRPAMLRPKVRIPNPQIARIKGGAGRVQRNRGRMSVPSVRNIVEPQTPQNIMPRIKKVGCLKVALNRLDNLDISIKEKRKGAGLLTRLFPKQGNNLDER